MHCVYFPPEVGGLESHVFHLCSAMADRGHRVGVVTSRSGPGLPRHEIMDGVEVWRTWMPGRNPVGWMTQAACSTPRLAYLARSADILHAQALQSVPPAAIAKRTSGAPLVTTWHTSHFLARADHPFWRPVFRRFIRWSDHNLAASREIAEVAESIATDRQVEALTNGVDTTLFRPVEPSLEPGGRRRIIVPRRLFEKNGVEYFIRGFPRICQSVNAEAVIVGDGPERGRLEALARELEVADRISFLGARPHDEMPGVLSSAEIAVFPSLMEATSVAALECMACELPVAASEVGGLPEIVDDEVGALFRPADAGDLAEAVVGLLASDRLAEMGRRARQRVVEHWSNERLTDRHLEIYASLVEGSGPS
jgi:glycosyltransferase involved in cell wall biosynthesis